MVGFVEGRTVAGRVVGCLVGLVVGFVEGRTVAGRVVGCLVGLVVGFVLGGAEGWSVGTVGLCVGGPLVPLVSVGSAGVPTFVRLRFPGCPGSPITPGRPIGPC